MEKTYLGENLYMLRKRRGFSQEELADQLGVSRQAISKWERNEAYPDTENLIALAQLYGVSLDALVMNRISDDTFPFEANVKFGESTAEDEAEISPDVDSGEQHKDVKVKISRGGIEVNVSSNDDVDIDDDDDDEDDDEDDNDPDVIASKNRFRFWYKLPYPIIVTVAYLLMGFLWEKGWAVGWTLYVTIPVYYTVIDCIRRKRLAPFCYPVFVAFIYLFVGMMWETWHPTWIMFVTIPIFYSIASAIDKRK